MTHAVYPSLAGKTVVVTGGGSGIGEVIVESFARQHSKVFFLDVAESDSKALVARLANGVKFVNCDVTHTGALREQLAAIERDTGPISVLVNNAANDDRHKFEEVTPEYWENRVAVNLRHLFFASQAVSAGMKKAGGGSIINLGSVSWHLSLPDLSLYETAKAGIEGMTRALARDLGPANIRVNCVVPGAIRTPRQMKLWHTPEEEAKILEQQCLKQRVDPVHVAAMVLFLASADAAMCTAHNYWVDAGYR
ncbi:MAG TPA: SDR family oxidoreductase [Steroidobacteraceae bacterium]|nr:SDR family oxidoreductase [Steroidobacteraceae bacterium]